MNAELQNNYPSIAELRRLRHDRIPVAFNAGDDALNVIVEINALGWRQNLDTVAHAQVAATALATAWAARRKTRSWR